MDILGFSWVGVVGSEERSWGRLYGVVRTFGKDLGAQ